jgi:hypothetical protein
MVLLLVWRLFERLLCNKIVPTVVTRVEPHKEAQLLLSFLYFRFIACWFILFILHPHQRHPKLLQVVWPYKEGVSYLNVCYKNHNFIIISKHLFCAYIMEILMLCGKRCPIIALVFFFFAMWGVDYAMWRCMRLKAKASMFDRSSGFIY